jgi:hypothetical protein
MSCNGRVKLYLKDECVRMGNGSKFKWGGLVNTAVNLRVSRKQGSSCQLSDN